MTTASEMLAEIQASLEASKKRLEELREQKAKLLEEKSKIDNDVQEIEMQELDVEEDIASADKTLMLANAVREDYAAEIAATKKLQRDAFNTLYAKASAGTATASEVVELGKVLGFPDPLEPEPETVEDLEKMLE